MTGQFRPLLGEDIKDVSVLRFPLLGSRKYDGIRGLVRRKAVGKDMDLFSRKLKLIPNRALARKFAIQQLYGIEGELIAGNPTAPDVMRATTSAVMTKGDHPDLAATVKLYVFDSVLDPS